MPSENGIEGWTEIECEFTPHAQRALALGRKEADRLRHGFVGTEHLLLGIVKLGQGVAVTVLQRMGIGLGLLRQEVEKQVSPGPEQPIPSTIPHTPQLKEVLAIAAEEAKALKHAYVGTEHLLLGLLGVNEGIAARALSTLHVNVERTREEVQHELDPQFHAMDSVPREAGTLPVGSSSGPQPDAIDTTKRYDVYCVEGDNEVIIRRNVLFKGTKYLLPGIRDDTRSQFVELEQVDGQRLFVALSSIRRFCKHLSDQAPGTTA